MTKEQTILEKKHKQFQAETSLALSVMWEWTEYKESDMTLVNDSIVNSYFNNPTVKKMLTSPKRNGLNFRKLSTRDVAKSYINHFKREHNIKPITK